MLVLASDLVLYQSQGVNSSGGVISGIIIDQTKISRLFVATTRAGIAGGQTAYMKFFIRNNNAALALLSAGVYSLSQPGDLERIAFAAGTSEDTDPTSLTFEETGGRQAAFLLGDIPIGAGNEVAVWVRRMTPAGIPVFDQAMFQLAIEGMSST